MIEVKLKDGTKTTRTMRELWNEFMNTKDYDYIQFSKTDSNFEPQPIVKEWLAENYPVEDSRQKYDLEWYFFGRI